jgi:hypothetical protein
MWRYFSANALIDGCRVEKTVAYDNASCSQCWDDDFANELRAACSEEEKLGFRREIFALGGVLEEVSD